PEVDTRGRESVRDPGPRRRTGARRAIGRTHRELLSSGRSCPIGACPRPAAVTRPPTRPPTRPGADSCRDRQNGPGGAKLGRTGSSRIGGSGDGNGRRGTPAVAGARAAQELRLGPGPARGLVRPVRGRGRRPHRRQRGRQVDAGQMPVRGGAAGLGRDPHRREAGGAGLPEHRPPPRHRDRLPGPRGRPRPRPRREPVPRPRALPPRGAGQARHARQGGDAPRGGRALRPPRRHPAGPGRADRVAVRWAASERRGGPVGRVGQPGGVPRRTDGRPRRRAARARPRGDPAGARHRRRGRPDQPQHAGGAGRGGPDRGAAPRHAGGAVHRLRRHARAAGGRHDRRAHAGGGAVTDIEVADVGAPPARRTLGQRLVGVSTFWIALVLAALCVLFSVLRPDAFPTLFTLQTLLIEASVLLVLAVGMTFVIITAGIDLSVGSVLVFSGVVAAKLMEGVSGGDASDAGAGVVLLGLVAALAGGGAWGLLNGLLVARAGIPPLIVTLGSFGAALGAAQLITDGVDVRTVPRVLRDGLGFGQTGQVPHMVALAAVVTLAGAWLLHTTRF